LFFLTIDWCYFWLF